VAEELKKEEAAASSCYGRCHHNKEKKLPARN
jgi:hypothetical protein